MPRSTAQQVYELARELPVGERLRLVEQLVHDLSAAPGDIAEARYDWRDLAGAAPGLAGEDAQTWVSRARETSDEQRAVEPRGRR
jgi:hypothetical protein